MSGSSSPESNVASAASDTPTPNVVPEEACDGARCDDTVAVIVHGEPLDVMSGSSSPESADTPKPNVVPAEACDGARCDVTVAVIVHGEPLDIRRVVSCIKEQDYSLGSVTILCLDDGTSPIARRVLDEMGIWTVDLPPRSSISVAKNRALELSTSEFVFFLDDHIYLDPAGLEPAMRVLQKDPHVAGVCGFYRSAKDTDYNILRDIKRHSIYGKSHAPRTITLDDFTTFSTGIAIVRRSVFRGLDFPEDVFPPDFGGEDVPALLTALNDGYSFAYVPALRGQHEHNLRLRQFIRKIEIEVRGRFSLFYWASNNPRIRVPYLHGFLNFPAFLTLSVPVALALVTLLRSPLPLILPASFLLFEILLSLRCLSTPEVYPLRDRLLSALYVLASDLLTPLCGLQYLLSSYRRPFRSLGWKQFFRMQRMFLEWELTKYGLLPRRSARRA